MGWAIVSRPRIARAAALLRLRIMGSLAQFRFEHPQTFALFPPWGPHFPIAAKLRASFSRDRCRCAQLRGARAAVLRCRRARKRGGLTPKRVRGLPVAPTRSFVWRSRVDRDQRACVRIVCAVRRCLRARPANQTPPPARCWRDRERGGAHRTWEAAFDGRADRQTQFQAILWTVRSMSPLRA